MHNKCINKKVQKHFAVENVDQFNFLHCNSKLLHTYSEHNGTYTCAQPLTCINITDVLHSIVPRYNTHRWATQHWNWQSVMFVHTFCTALHLETSQMYQKDSHRCTDVQHRCAKHGFGVPAARCTHPYHQRTYTSPIMEYTYITIIIGDTLLWCITMKCRLQWHCTSRA